MATKRGCKKVGRAAPKKRGGPCGKKLKKKGRKKSVRKSTRRRRKK